jgi:hypothetical protein
MLYETPIADCYKVKLRSVFAEANKIPNLLHEIGRLREITFREVGEGTKSIDLDKFDQYYHHLSYGTMKKKNCRSISNGIRLRNLSKTRDRRFLFE